MKGNIKKKLSTKGCGYMVALLMSAMSLSAYGQQQTGTDDSEAAFVRTYENYLSKTELSLDMEISYSRSGESVSGIPNARYKVRRDGNRFFSDDGISIRIIDGTGKSLLIDRESRRMLLGKSDGNGEADEQADYAEVLSQWTRDRGRITKKSEGLYEMIPSEGMVERLLIRIDTERDVILETEYFFRTDGDWEMPYDRMRVEYLVTDFNRPDAEWFDIGKYIDFNGGKPIPKTAYSEYNLEIYKND